MAKFTGCSSCRGRNETKCLARDWKRRERELEMIEIEAENEKRHGEAQQQQRRQPLADNFTRSADRDVSPPRGALRATPAPIDWPSSTEARAVLAARLGHGVPRVRTLSSPLKKVKERERREPDGIRARRCCKCKRPIASIVANEPDVACLLSHCRAMSERINPTVGD